MSQLLSLVSYDDHFDHWKSIFAIIIAAITEPLYGYLEDVVSVRPFSLVFQQNRHVSRIDLWHTATGKLQQLRQQQRKQENNKKATGLNWTYSTLFCARQKKYCNSRFFQALHLPLLLQLLNYFSGCCSLIETSL